MVAAAQERHCMWVRASSSFFGRAPACPGGGSDSQKECPHDPTWKKEATPPNQEGLVEVADEVSGHDLVGTCGSSVRKGSMIFCTWQG